MNYRKILKNVARKFGYEICKIGKINYFETLVYKYYHNDFFFIQIGANDGQRFDPLFAIVKLLGLKGLAVEPIKEYFDELTKNYSGTKVIPVNKAIYSNNQKITMHRVISTNSLPDWTKGIASINADHHKKSKIDESFIIEEEVEAITIEALLLEYNVEKFDLLQLDTEGFDKNIIEMFPFDSVKPNIIHFEHGLRDEVMTIKDFLETTEILLGQNYKLIMEEYDCIAYL